nr:MAG: replication associated protein [Cressdnaviricota sp.]
MTSSDEDSMGSMSSTPTGRRGDQGNQLVVWDFTLAKVHVETDTTVEAKDLKDKLIESCSAWGFQLEEAPTTKYLHYQGRLRLNERKRLPEVKALLGYSWIHLTKTSTNAAKKDNFYNYVTKNATRVDGPWTNKIEEDLDLPFDWVEDDAELRPFQTTIFQSVSGPADRRKVNVVIDAFGNSGKSTLYEFLVRKRIEVFRVPTYCSNGRELSLACTSWIMNLGKETRLRKVLTFIVDLPRNIEAKRDVWCCIEDLKNGSMTETRYATKVQRFAKPHVWVFCNQKPDTTVLTGDRWKLWTISNNFELIPYDEETE